MNFFYIDVAFASATQCTYMWCVENTYVDNGANHAHALVHVRALAHSFIAYVDL